LAILCAVLARSTRCLFTTVFAKKGNVIGYIRVSSDKQDLQKQEHLLLRMLAAWKMLPSVSGVGNCYDNAPAESWFATLKVACVDVVYDTKQEARADLFAYMEVFYNRQRLHSQRGYLSPAAFAQQHHQLVNRALPLVH